MGTCHDVAVGGRAGDHGRHKRHGVLPPHVKGHHPLVDAVIIVPVPSFLSTVVEVVARARLHLGESLVLHVLCGCVVEVGHGRHGVHGSSHGGWGDGFGLLDAGGREL